MKRFGVLILNLLVCVAITAANATFKKIWLEHNVIQNGEKGMTVHVSFDISGMKGQKCQAIAYFDNPKGTGVKDRNGRYCTTGGNVCSSTHFTPGYPNTTYSDLSIFIPNSELHLLPGKRTYYTRVFIQMPDGKFLANSDFASFDGTGSSQSNSNQPANNSNRNNLNRSIQTWREELDYGMFAINKGYPNGARLRTTYRPCISCRGSVVCSNCAGMKICGLCKGMGGIVTPGYGNYIPCGLCNRTGNCGICHGTGQCACAKYEYPGYMPGSTTLVGADGSILTHTSYSGGGSSSSSTPHSRSSSSHSFCRRCCGTGVEPTPGTGNGMSSWVAYHNIEGNKCPYCSQYNSHNHDRCSSCNVPR